MSILKRKISSQTADIDQGTDREIPRRNGNLPSKMKVITFIKNIYNYML